ncbi:MAG: RdgB/HAM1 family non-canonical purine NTP pyrophosphatase [Bacteroidia bacterium]
MEVFFGTNNPHKLKEIQEILGEAIRVKSFRDLDEKFDVEETEDTLEGNALLKARAFFKHTGLPCFSDDSGLEVAALGGAPGVYSKRYSGLYASAEANNTKLLEALQDEENRQAQFRAVIAYVDADQEKTFEGRVVGTILVEPTGEGGFGYDPLFQPEGYAISFAEMNADEKNRISHRGRAVAAFTQWLKNR